MLPSPDVRVEPASVIADRADVLFALGRLPRSVSLHGRPPGWTGDLRERSFEVVERDADVAVADAGHVDEALAAGARAVVVDGTRASTAALASRRAGVRRLLPLPLHGSPVTFADLAQRRAAAYAVQHALAHPERWRSARNAAVAALLRVGVTPPFPAVIGVADDDGDQPAFVRAAADVGVSGTEWVMLVSPGSVVRRNALLVFEHGRRVPLHVIKFSRVRGATVTFDREERGIAELRSVGGAAARRAPAYLGRFDVDGWHAAAETAAVGSKLSAYLRRPVAERQKVARVEEVARWLLQLAHETASDPAALEPERRRVASEVLSHWRSYGVDPNLMTSIPPVPGTFQHNDLAEENVVVGDGGFTVLDWEWARRDSLPFGDLTYFAVHVLRIIDSVEDDEGARERHFVELCAGDAPSSRRFFGWIAELARTLGIGSEAVGPLVTASWLSRAVLSAQERARAEAVGRARLEPAFAERIARRWLEHPGLGPRWAART